jgi:DNA polymerase-3 subunit gamma/tau
MAKSTAKSASSSGGKPTAPRKPARKSSPAAKTALGAAAESTSAGPARGYLVLARKYRPADFSSLIGQDAMVQTLTNAFASGRIAHAFMLTGVRGVGKTTTARILARAFNYVDQTGPHPTLDLQQEGEHCRAIIESRHVDVVEMDAASHTGIDDIREINESTRYGPVTAPFKVFIIDEVHMLSKNAFNGLLKTLEEPPPYVKFIFATTEIRKVPVTVLSRCQRFDLRRVGADVMRPYLEGILQTEEIECEPDALSLIIRAGEGSVRDCLSLMDQAIAHAGGAIEAGAVRAMLGLADRARSIDMFEALMAGRVEAALEGLREQYEAGADPATLVADLAQLAHLATRLKVVPEAASDPALTPDERDRGAALAGKLGLRVLGRAWQILLKGHAEVLAAPDALAAAEMVLVRLAHAADLPTPDEVIAELKGADSDAAAPAPRAPAAATAGSARLATAPQAAAEPAAPPETDPTADIASWADLVAMAGARRDLIVKHALEAQLSPVAIEPGRLEVALAEGADPGIIQTLSARLRHWTGRPWLITVSGRAAAPTLAERRKAEAAARLDAAQADPAVRAALDAFPGSRVVAVRRREDEDGDAAGDRGDAAIDENDENDEDLMQ